MGQKCLNSLSLLYQWYHRASGIKCGRMRGVGSWEHWTACQAASCVRHGLLRTPAISQRAQHVLLSSLPSEHEKRDPERSNHWSKGKEPGSGEMRFKPRTAGFRVICTAPALLTGSLSNACPHRLQHPKGCTIARGALTGQPLRAHHKTPIHLPFLGGWMSPGARL